jgi:hypothetical protein
MGFRTVVILYNDQRSEWQHDELLGQKIMQGMNHAMGGERHDWQSPANLHYGNVMECTHADTISLYAIDSYYGRRLATGTGSWRAGPDVVDLELIKEAASKLGYRLVKKS